MIKKYISIVASALILALVVTGCSTENNAWATEVQEIAANEDAIQYKYSAVEAYEREYTASIKELEQFYKELSESFESGKYLNGGTDVEVLTDLFKAVVLANQATGGPQQFAAMYLNNVKYVYLGIEEPAGEQVLVNEKLMMAILKNAL